MKLPPNLQPFVHLFHSDGQNYAYDVNTNQILAVEPVLAAVLPLFGARTAQGIVKDLSGDFSQEQIQETIEAVGAAQREEGLFLPRQVNLIPPETSIKKTIPPDPFFRHLVLTLTERCNLRCTYCPFGADLKWVRSHGNRDMAPNLGKKAIEYFLDKADPDKQPVVSFYGGEPLLVPELLGDLVTAIRSHPRGSHVMISVDTNGVLLTDQVVEFLAKEEIFLQVSLDGPREVHDRNRITSGDGPTFRRIMDGLNRLLCRDVSSADRLSFIVTLTPGVDLQAVADFYLSFPPFADLGISQVPRVRVNRADLSGQTRPGLVEGWKELERQISQARSSYKGAVRNLRRPQVSPVIRSLFEPGIIRLYHRADIRLGDHFTPGGNCQPGYRKLHVTLDGAFQACERTNRLGVIGEIGSGIDIEQVEELRTKFHEAVMPGCATCWALRLCGICYAVQLQASQMGVGVLNQYCKNLRKTRSAELALLTDILEMPPECRSWLDLTSVD